MARYGESPFRYPVPPPKRSITERDQQAMYNFAKDSHISLEAIAENYDCSDTHVVEVVNTRPWLRSKPHNNTSVNMTWWESDHSDPLELAKIFYPEYCESSETTVKEKQEEMTAQEYFDSIDWGAAYKEGGMAAWDAIEEEGIRRFNAESL